MVKCNDINSIKYRDTLKPKKKYIELKNITAIDTETQDGKAFIIGIRTKFSKQIYKVTSMNHIFYIFSKLHPETIIFYYNIDYDVSAMLKFMTESQLRFFAKYDYIEFPEHKTRFDYIPGKCFTITYLNYFGLGKHKQVRMFDLAQFCNKMPLSVAGEEFIKIKKISDILKKHKIDISKLSITKYTIKNDYREILNKYLVRDIDLTYNLGIFILNLCVKDLDVHIKRPYSQASISQQLTLEKIKRVYKLPSKKILDMSLKAFNGGWFETVKRGTFDNVDLLDINSAYPDTERNLPALDTGVWIKNNKYDIDSLISLFRCEVKITSDLHISPVKYYDHKAKKLTYPLGQFKQLYINKDEYEQISRFGTVKIKEAYHYKHNSPSDIEKPFNFVSDLYDKRVKMKKYKQGNQLLVKIAINGLYGKFIQLVPIIKDVKVTSKNMKKLLEKKDLIHDEYTNEEGELIFRIKNGYKAGLLFNPVYANEITAKTRTKIFKTFVPVQEHVINIATDGVMTTKIPRKIDLHEDKLGSWGFEIKNKPATIIGSGLYFYPKGDRTVAKFRGFDTSIDIKDLLHKNPTKNKVLVELNKPLKLKRVCRLTRQELPSGLKLPFKDLIKNVNVFTSFPKVIDINFDSKRDWTRPFDNCNDVLNNIIESRPFTQSQ